MRLYEFNLENFTVKDWLVIATVDMQNKSGVVISPETLEEFLSVIDRHTNTNVMELPMEEISNLLAQFGEALAYQFGNKK